jgi:hypothetical protein
MRNIIKKILREESELNKLKRLVDSYEPTNVELALIMSEGLGLKKEVLELLINRIIKEIKTIDENEPDEYSNELSFCINYIDNVKINEIKEYEPPKTKYSIHINTYASNISPYYDFSPVYGEVEWEFKKLTNEKLYIIEDQIVLDKLDKNW